MSLESGKRVLLLETAECPLEGVGEILSQRGLRVSCARSLAHALKSIHAREVDLVVGRLCYCFQQPLELLRQLARKLDAPPVVIAAAGADVPLYLEAMQRGAFDCVALPPSEPELIRIVARALAPQPELSVSSGGRQ